MKPSFDEIMISSYIDGELDAQLMPEAEKLIEENDSARRVVLESVRATARLRQSMNQGLKREIPEQLLDSIRSHSKKTSHSKSSWTAGLAVAASILLFVFGAGLGWLMASDRRDNKTFLMMPFPASYRQVVDQALENNLSGVAQRWDAPDTSVRVTVTPVRTYRQKAGRYYREYRLEVNSQTESGQINGLAYRSSPGRWVTAALILNGEN